MWLKITDNSLWIVNRFGYICLGRWSQRCKIHELQHHDSLLLVSKLAGWGWCMQLLCLVRRLSKLFKEPKNCQKHFALS